MSRYLIPVYVVFERIHCDICGNAYPPPILSNPPATLQLTLEGSIAMERFSYRMTDGLSFEDVERAAAVEGWSREVIHGTVKYFCPECVKK